MGNWAVAFLKRVYNREMQEFVLSCARDLFMGLVVLLCSVIFHVCVGRLSKIGYPDWVAGTWHFIDYAWVTAVLSVTAYMFVMKLISKARVQQR
jgi:hypothetical protein